MDRGPWRSIVHRAAESDTEQQTGSKLGQEYDRTVYCHLAYLTYAEYIIQNARLPPAHIIEVSAQTLLLGGVFPDHPIQVCFFTAFTTIQYYLLYLLTHHGPGPTPLEHGLCENQDPVGCVCPCWC